MAVGLAPPLWPGLMPAAGTGAGQQFALLSRNSVVLCSRVTFHVWFAPGQSRLCVNLSHSLPTPEGLWGLSHHSVDEA